MERLAMERLLPGGGAEFQSFVDCARPRNELWRILLGLPLIGLLWIVPGVGAFFLVEFLIQGNLAGVIETRAELSGPSTALVFIALFVFAIPAIWLVLKLLHGRTLISLFGPTGRLDLKAFRKATVFMALFVSVGLVFALTSGTAIPNLEPLRWLLLLPIAIPLILIQCSAEELVFRGYILQQIGSRFGSRWAWWVVPAAIFAALHWDSRTFASNAPLVVLAAFLLGLIAADVTARTGNLGTAIGLHFTNNVYAILVLGMPGPISGLALYQADIDLTNIAETRTGLLLQIGIILIAYLVYVFVVTRKPARQLQSGPANFN